MTPKRRKSRRRRRAWQRMVREHVQGFRVAPQSLNYVPVLDDCGCPHCRHYRGGSSSTVYALGFRGPFQ